MKQPTQVYRWSIQMKETDSVYNYCGFPFAGTIANYKKEVSGFVRKDRVNALLVALIPFGVDKVNMVTSERYWKNYDSYK